jgi:REP element-mobilizing transposase RayT
MARKPRIHYPGAVYHVILRGNAGQPIFFADTDRYRLYLFLQYVVEKFGCRIHGFCLMTNHIHLIMQTSAVPLSRIMQNLSLRYTKWINFTQSRTGHVFQGRYKALLLDADSYLMELVRYTHLNPVRAGMTHLPDDYPWSGHRSYLGKEMLPWLTTDYVLSMFSANILKARNCYASFVADGIGETKREEFYSGTCEGRILGDDNFTDKAFTKANQSRDREYLLSDLVGIVCRRYGTTIDQLKAPGKARPYSEARAVIALLVQELPGSSLTEAGKFLNRSIAPLGRAGRRLLTEALENTNLNVRLNEMRLELLK